MLLFFFLGFPRCFHITRRFPSVISVAPPSGFSPLPWIDERAEPERKGGSWQVTEGILGAGGSRSVCGLCSVLHLYLTPSVFTKPVAEGHTLLERKTGFLPRQLSGALLGRRKTELEKREEGQGKNTLQRVRSEPGQKMFLPSFYIRHGISR